MELLTCEGCGVTNEDVLPVLDQYTAEIYNKNVVLDLCPDCNNERVRDI